MKNKRSHKNVCIEAALGSLLFFFVALPTILLIITFLYTNLFQICLKPTYKYLEDLYLKNKPIRQGMCYEGLSERTYKVSLCDSDTCIVNVNSPEFNFNYKAVEYKKALNNKTLFKQIDCKDFKGND